MARARGAPEEKTTSASLWAKAFQKDAEWNEEDFLTVVFWAKQLAAFVAAVLVGILGITGPPGFVA